MVAWAFVTKHSEDFSRQVILSWFATAGLAQVLLHTATNYAMQYYLNKRKTMISSIIVGTGSLASYLARKLNKNPWTEHRIIGVVAGSKESKEDWGVDGVPFIGQHEELRGIVERCEVRRVYFA